jgi:hypothetical protein
VELRTARPKRSNQANRYYHGVVVKAIADHCGYQPDEMHELLAMKFLRLDDDPVTGAPRRLRTPACNTAEFAAYIEQIRLWAASELDVHIPEASQERAA